MINAANIFLARKDVSFLSGVPAKPGDTSCSRVAFPPSPMGTAPKEKDRNLVPLSGAEGHFQAERKEKQQFTIFL